ncbi:MAG: TonB family protein [Bacteroidales bacterium]|nr:TonB family protein [Bacteroidales bacterium]
MQQDKKDKTISAVSTAIIMFLCVLLCSWIGYKLPNPPIEEEGMGVAGEVLGEIEGFGNNDNATFDDNSATASSSSTPEESYTASEEPSPVAKTPKTEEAKPNPVKKPEPAKTTTDNNSNAKSETPQPTTNPNATFKGKKNGNGGEGKGTATGSGQAGSPDGTQGAQGGDGKGNGAGYSLGGRSLRGTLPVPSYNSTKEGNVVVRIKVDQSGNVVEVDAPYKGSYNYDDKMVREAKEAAKRAHFNADASATEYQYGTITYRFRRQG